MDGIPAAERPRRTTSLRRNGEECALRCSGTTKGENECVHRRSTFASMRNIDSESDAESGADTESVVVDEGADSVVWDAVKTDARLRTRTRLETCQTTLVEYGNQMY